VVLQELRALVGLTQEELAEQMGVQQAAISRLERREDIAPRVPMRSRVLTNSGDERGYDASEAF
jgi:transcriptional regulator with XRE-family HTH domain